MKLILTFCNLFLVSFFLFGQPTFQKTIGTVGDEEANWMIPSASGGFLIGGFSGTAGTSNQKALLLKVDQHGDFLWQKSVEATGQSLFFRKILEAPDGSIFGIGTSNKLAFNDENALVVKFKSTGQIEWVRNLGGSEREWGYHAIWSQNHLVVVGRTESFGAGDADLLLFKLKNDGSLVWARAFGGSGNDWAGDVVEALDGNLIACANAVSWTTNGYHDILHVKVNQNGDLISSATNRRDNDDGMNHLFRLSDGKLLGVDATWENGNSNLRGWLVKMDDAGNEIWSKLIEKGSDNILMNASEAADGTLIGAFYDRPPGPNSDGLFAKFDKNGNLLFSKKFGGTQQDLIRRAIGLPDGGILAVGMTRSFGAGGSDIFLLRTDEKGEVENCCSSDAGLFVKDGDVQKMTVSTSQSSASGLAIVSWQSADFQAVSLPFCEKIEAEFSLSAPSICSGQCIFPKNEAIQPDVEYEWIFDSGSPAFSTAAQPDSVCFAAAGVFQITLRATNGECMAEKTATVTVGGQSVAMVDSVKICPGDSIFLNGKWLRPPASTSDTTASGGGCLKIKTTVVAARSDSVAIDSVGLCRGDSVWLEGRWIFGPTIIETIEIIEKGCVLIRKTVVFERSAGCPVRCKIFWPNVFSPNDDGKNDRWFPAFDCPLENFDLKIFDRWGELLWQTDDPKSEGWDGVFRGKKMDNAVVVFVAEFDVAEKTGGPTKRLLEKGSIMLAR